MRRFPVAAILLPATLLCATGAAQAGPRDDVLYGISRCGGIPDDHAWLDCVYGAAQPMRSSLGLPPAPAAQVKLVPPPMPGGVAPSFAAAAAPSPPPVTSAAAQMAPPRAARKKSMWSRMWSEGNDPVVADVLMESYKFDRKGVFTVSLSNGQVWSQDPKEAIHPDWSASAKNYIVKITLDSNHNFKLSVAGEPNTYTVQRLK